MGCFLGSADPLQIPSSQYVLFVVDVISSVHLGESFDWVQAPELFLKRLSGSNTVTRRSEDDVLASHVVVSASTDQEGAAAPLEEGTKRREERKRRKTTAKAVVTATPVIGLRWISIDSLCRAALDPDPAKRR